MSAGFFVSGSTVGGGYAPLVQRFQIAETCYQGQLVMSGTVGGLGGHVQVADVASEALENDQPIIGVVQSVRDASRTYNATYRGDGSTYTTNQATIAANGGPGEVDVALIIPGITKVRGPIYNGAFGTALTVVTVTTASAGGTTITHAGDTITDIADGLCTAYCRSGANRGLYRIVTTGGANANVVTVPFPYAIAVGDTFVIASVVLGMGGLDFPATANCIDGNVALINYYPVHYTQIDLSEAGKEWAEFVVHPKATWTAA